MITKKSSEQLYNQSYLFLNKYSKISDQIKKSLKVLLSLWDVTKEEIWNYSKQLWMSDEEFNAMRDDYVFFLRENIKDKYVWAKNNISSQIKKENLYIIMRQAGITSSNELITMKDILVLVDPKILRIIVREAGITDPNELITMKNLLIRLWNGLRQCENLKIIVKEAHIKDSDTLIRMEYVLNRANTENLKIILNKFPDLKYDQFIKLQYVLEINNFQYLNFLVDEIWIDLDYLFSLDTRVCYYDDKYLKNVQILKEAWINRPDQLFVMYDKYDPEKLRVKIEILKEKTWITDPDQIFALKDILLDDFDYNKDAIWMENLSFLKRNGITANELSELKDILRKSRPGSLWFLFHRGIYTSKKLKTIYSFSNWKVFNRDLGRESKFDFTIIDYAIDKDYFYYLDQNLSTLDELKIDFSPKNEAKIKEILDATWWFLTKSLIKRFVLDKNNTSSIKEILQEYYHIKDFLLSGKEILIKEFDMEMLCEVIYLTYRPTWFTEETIRKGIESWEIQDHSDHLKEINTDKYSFSLTTMEMLLKDNIQLNDKFFTYFASLERIKDEEKHQQKPLLYRGFIRKLLDPSYVIDDDFAKHIFGYNNDPRLVHFCEKYRGDQQNYDCLKWLQEMYDTILKDSFWELFLEEFDKMNKKENGWSLFEDFFKDIQERIKKVSSQILWMLNNREKQKLTISQKKEIQRYRMLIEKISKWKYDDEDMKYTLKDFLLQRLIDTTSGVRKFLKQEEKKFLEKATETEKINIDCIVTKNLSSFFSKAWSELCTAKDIWLWNRKDHIHLDLLDKDKKIIVGNIMLYFDPNRNYLIVRWFNPRQDFLDSVDAEKLAENMIEAVKKIAKNNWYKKIYMPQNWYWHALSNRIWFNKYFEKHSKQFENREDYEIFNANFQASSEYNEDELFLLDEIL